MFYVIQFIIQVNSDCAVGQKRVELAHVRRYKQICTFKLS